MFYRIYKLTMMQLGEKLNINVVHNKKTLLIKSLYKFMSIILLSFLIFVIFFVIKGFLHIKINISILILLLMAIQLVSLLATTSGLIHTMYMAKDNELLFSYPVKANEIFISKMAVYLVYEFLRNLTFVLPLIIAFALSANLGVPLGYYFLIMPVLLLLSIMPVLIGVLVSIPVTFVTRWLKERALISGILVFLLLGITFYLVMSLTSSLPETFSLIGMYGRIYPLILSTIDKITKFGIYTINIAKVMMNTDVFINSLIILGIITVLIVSAFFISRPIYFKMAVNSYEFSNKRKYKFSNRMMNKPFLSAFSKEFKLLRRSSSTFIGTLITLVTLPLILYLFNSIVGMFNIKTTGSNIILAFNIFLGLIILLSANSNSASAFSKEGSQAYLLKVTPLSIRKQAFAKIVFNLILSITVLTFSCIAIFYTTQISGLNMFYIFILFLLIDIAHILWSLEIDFMNPQFKLHETNEDTKDNKNVAKSVLIGVVIALFIAVYAFISLNSNIKLAWVKLFIIAALFLGVRVFLFVNRLHVYHKRIEI